MSTVANPLALEILHSRFLVLLPRLEMHGRIYFRHLKCHDRKADAIQEMRALAWKWFLRLCQRGKDPAEFISAFVAFLARAVSSGRRLVGMEKSKDAMCPVAQKRYGFVVERLPDFDVSGANPLFDALRDNMVTPPPEAASFRIDFPRWMAKQSRRDRRIICDLMVGGRTGEVARKFSLSPARVAQLRRQFREDWAEFGADPAELFAQGAI